MEQTPAEILTAFDASLREMRTRIQEHTTLQDEMQEGLRKRAEETARFKADMTARIESARTAEKTARDAAQRARTSIDALFRGVEDGTLTLPDPTPLGNDERDQATRAANEAADTLEQAQQRLAQSSSPSS